MAKTCMAKATALRAEKTRWCVMALLGYVVSYGESLYRGLDAVERLQSEGIDVGLINKATLNMVNEALIAKLGRSPFVLVVNSRL